jgi:nicotinate phosphoribosyltransferase
MRWVPGPFFDYLTSFRFTGEVWAVPEGTPVFANEPLLRVTAPLAQAQLIETAALAFVNYQTSVASKGARVVSAARGRPVMEFGARRAHGVGAALYAARAAYVAGCTSTSFVEAGREFGIPLSGTMAHSWILSSPTEIEAFQDYAALFGDHSALLLDTYDTVEAARGVVRSGLRPVAVRLDSGDVLTLSRRVRAILDEGGLRDTRIVASGDVDEFIIASLLGAGAPIDSFGVGTALVTSQDAPALGGVYKLVEIEEDGEVRRVMKRSSGKATWPGRKQIWRVLSGGTATGDIIAFEDEPSVADAVPLVRPVMRGGRRIEPVPSLESSRSWCADRLAELPEDLKAVDADAVYRAEPSGALRAAISPILTP